MDVKLVVVGGKSAGRQLPISKTRFLIGRGADCQLRPGSPLVGVHHCVILSEEGRAVLEDLGTPNGTYVNGKRVAGQRELHTGDKLRIGPLEFEVQITVTVQGKKKPKIQSIQEAAARLADTGKPDELDVSLWIGDTSTSDESITDMLQQQQEDAEWLEETPTESQVQVTPAEVDSSKPATANSQDAAANVLRQLFGNK